ncbi:5-formyltetrahydrofolate cyclo-ligase [Qipengyuania marisflavi]|uniref:5-formyltetrahydrofolate cyclo-ligase n=1 Tax=Qipengyuania marisflavi TaxID=2486356 RepID=A0A5S3P8B5_9SPHN|nr:5-formyltetrahydrofolate cyclo-ligase [Qipengyuania marisflavi]TMM49742.1 5-formyltetrahydrofolate cyclo-ligase [Qipengyuania marisflavi]
MTKQDLRKTLRAARHTHVDALPDAVRALVFHRPPAPFLQMIPPGAAIGLYRANPHEAPTASYAKFLFEAGHELGLPRFAESTSPMEFARFTDPFEESDLETGPFDLLQPVAEAEAITPAVIVVPLIGFTARGERLGQGGGHYDRWLADHPDGIAVGLGWDCQLVDQLPTEPHDRSLSAIITPTRIYGPF